MKLCYNEATAMGCSNLETDLKLCEKEGFDYIELRLDMLKEYLQEHTVSELKQFFATSRIKPHALNALYVYTELFGEQDDTDKQRKVVEEFLFGCEVAKEIGSEYFIIVPPLQRDPSGGPFVGTWEETYTNCVRILKELSQLARPFEMKLCFELVGFERSSVRSIEQVSQIVTEVNEDNVGYVLDSYNIFLNGKLNEFSSIKQLEKEKIFAVHLMSGDDVPTEEMGQDKRCFPGDGVVDTNNFLKNLMDIGYDGMVSVETFRPQYWTLDPEWVIHAAYETTRFAVQNIR